MPVSEYLRISIDDQDLDVTSLENSDVSISYKLEDRDDFQQKKSSQAVSMKFPATLTNDKISNTAHNPGIEDLTSGSAFKGYRGCVIEAMGNELLVGKAKLKRAGHTNVPTSYEYDFYGNNADWMIDLQEKTLYDFLKDISFVFTTTTIENSWNYDGTNPNLPYCFVPVRYSLPFEPLSGVNDYSISPLYLKPSLSPYFLLFKAFKSLGYKIQSDFLDSAYFRKQLMPWTWGNFLLSDGSRLDMHKFLAKSVLSYYRNQSTSQSDTLYGIDINAVNVKDGGAFDNNKDYSYDASTGTMRWQYKAPHYGVLDAVFSIQIDSDATVAGNSDCELRVQWFKNGVQFNGGDGTDYQTGGNEVFTINNNGIGRSDHQGVDTLFCHTQVDPADNGGAGTIITAKLYLHIFASSAGRANIKTSVIGFQLDYFKIPLGGTIDFVNYTGFIKHKFLDFFRGIIDTYNLSVQTDSINKVVFIEPTHPYGVGSTAAIASVGDFNSDFNIDYTSGGQNENIPLQVSYFNEDFIDWSDKQDLSKDSFIEQFSDSCREINFRFKDDSTDGLLKLLQERNQNILASGKYVLPSRFITPPTKNISVDNKGSIVVTKTGGNDMENRFFSPVVHCDIHQWDGIKSITTQMVALIPENISNTSAGESANSFSPKLIYYKGLDYNQAFVYNGAVRSGYPFAFAVNYLPGGESDPVLSYCDENINGTITKGLLRKFFLQRMAILRNGEFYNTFFNLVNNDITNWFHREHIICRGQRWELIEINSYKPLTSESTACYLRKWVPITAEDWNSVYPARTSIADNTTNAGAFDIKYAPLKCLPSDIPTI